MAIYHLSAKPIQRSKGRSAVASAAYRAAERIEDKRTGAIHDYTKKSGVIHTEIITPSGEEISRAILWNLAEQAEKRKDGTPSREYEVALPNELTSAQRIELTREFVNYLVKEQGCAVDFAIHSPGKNGDTRNHHVHILCTTRRYEPGQVLGVKCDIELSDRDRYKKNLPGRKVGLENIREKWAELINNALEKANQLERVSHKSFLSQGIELMPTIHIGVTSSAMERRGIQTERGDKYRDCIKYNINLQTLQKEQVEVADALETQKGIESVRLKAQIWRINKEKEEAQLIIEKEAQDQKLNNLQNGSHEVFTPEPQIRKKSKGISR